MPSRSPAAKRATTHEATNVQRATAASVASQAAEAAAREKKDKKSFAEVAGASGPADEPAEQEEGDKGAEDDFRHAMSARVTGVERELKESRAKMNGLQSSLDQLLAMARQQQQATAAAPAASAVTAPASASSAGAGAPSRAAAVAASAKAAQSILGLSASDNATLQVAFTPGDAKVTSVAPSSPMNLSAAAADGASARSSERELLEAHLKKVKEHHDSTDAGGYKPKTPAELVSRCGKLIAANPGEFQTFWIQHNVLCNQLAFDNGFDAAVTYHCAVVKAISEAGSDVDGIRHLVNSSYSPLQLNLATARKAQAKPAGASRRSRRRNHQNSTQQQGGVWQFRGKGKQAAAGDSAASPARS